MMIMELEISAGIKELFKDRSDGISWQQNWWIQLANSRAKKTVRILNGVRNTGRGTDLRRKNNKPGFQKYDFEIPEG